MPGQLLPACSIRDDMPPQENTVDLPICPSIATALSCRGASMTELAEIVSQFGTSAKGKLANPAVTGAPEDQLRAPLEMLVLQLAELAGHPRLIGEVEQHRKTDRAFHDRAAALHAGEAEFHAVTHSFAQRQTSPCHALHVRNIP
jgi:hypothetical protein